MKARTTLLIVLACMIHLTTALGQKHSQKCRIGTPADSSTVSADSSCTPKKAKANAYDELLSKGGSGRDGLFLVRHIKDDWYFEVPEHLLGRLLLMVTRFTAVPEKFKMVSGEMVNSSTVYFEQRDEKTLLLREYVKSQFAPADDNIANALTNATVSPIVCKFDVIGRNPDTRALLVNVSKFILNENKITGFSSKDKSYVELGGLVADRSFVDSIKTYPINTEIQTVRTYNVSSGSSSAVATGFVTIGLNTSIVLLPETPMRPRLADERVGYFQNKMTAFSDEQQTTENDAVVSRYRLEPKDLKRYLSGKLTEPKKQIVYYIDPATPAKWVPYLKAGIDDWNKAFEAAGFKNAIVGKEWPNDSTMSLDDARFSVLRYLPSEKENAYGPRIVDPRSGEIMESHVCWYHNVMNLVKKWYVIQCGAVDKRARSMNFDDKLMGELIRFVSSHEVGHTLGLRHNMMASSATPVEKLRDKEWVEKYGHTSSIMDYARFNYVAQPEDNISAKGLFPRINDYDKWAIKWGYQYRPEFNDPYDEKRQLRNETTKVLTNNKRLRYVGDEGKGADPRSQSEDLGDNSMVAGDYGIRNLKVVMENIVKWTAEPDGQYDKLSQLHKSARAQFSKYCNHVQKNLAGKYFNNWPSEKSYEYVPKSMQKQAVEWIGRQVFNAPLWLYPDNVVDRLGIDAIDEIRNRQSTLIAYLLSPGMLYNIHNGSMRSSDPYPVDEFLDDVEATVWQPLTNQDERMNNYRRQLQNSYVSFLAKAINPDAKSLSGIGFAASQSDIGLYAHEHLGRLESHVRELLADAKGINKLHFERILIELRNIRNNYEKKHNDDGIACNDMYGYGAKRLHI